MIAAAGAAAIACAVAGTAIVVPAIATPLAGGESRHTSADLGRDVLPDDDGWGSYHGVTRPDGIETVAAGTTGGAAAADDEVHAVDTWAELRDALSGGNGADQAAARASTTPRVIYVTGPIDAFEAADGTTTTCEDIASQVTVPGTGAPFSMDDYIAHFDPSGPWGRAEPSGPLEDARLAAQAAQAAQTQQHVGSNVTIVGVSDDARIMGANLRVRGAHNVILRNLTFSDAYDCFPQWDPADGATGNWNSAYDNVSLWTATSVWVDHSTFDDGDHPAESLPEVFGRKFEVHDGLLDITHGSDLVTVSWNKFLHHDKTMLIGSSDSRVLDRGQHRVTLHHNYWEDIGQRAPRVRFGDVHVYNNYYRQTEAGIFNYYWGAGIESSVVAENNAVQLAPGVAAGRITSVFKGTMLRATGTRVNGHEIDVVGAYNETATTPLSPAARWTPADVYPYELHPNRAVPHVVPANAGAGVLLSELPRSLG
ncbi:pectate lyase [Myceligenerans crystallogenes]|uniref:Pectate lyase n=2 Tax=Myceligenerans crystallogenes TaxID=316335 RepID=A0ABN2N2C5_9MICO